MDYEIKEGNTPSKIGKAYYFKHHDKFHGILETKAGAYRGNHTHPVNQYTLLLNGQAKYLLFEGKRHEVDLVIGEVFECKAGVPHILVPEEDTFTFEWWDGDFVSEEVSGIFEDIIINRVGPGG